MTSPLLSPLFSELDEPFDFVMHEDVDGTETSRKNTSPVTAEDTPRMGQRYSNDSGYTTDPDELSEVNEDTSTYSSSPRSTASHLTTRSPGTPPSTFQGRARIPVWYELMTRSHHESHDVLAGKETHTWLLSNKYESNASESEQSEIEGQLETGREQRLESQEPLRDHSEETEEQDAKDAMDLDEHMEAEEEADDEAEDEEEEGGEEEEEEGEGEEEEECGEESYLMDMADAPEGENHFTHLIARSLDDCGIQIPSLLSKSIPAITISVFTTLASMQGERKNYPPLIVSIRPYLRILFLGITS